MKLEELTGEWVEIKFKQNYIRDVLKMFKMKNKKTYFVCQLNHYFSFKPEKISKIEGNVIWLKDSL